jgi:hypothetical protein
MGFGHIIAVLALLLAAAAANFHPRRYCRELLLNTLYIAPQCEEGQRFCASFVDACATSEFDEYDFCYKGAVWLQGFAAAHPDC